MIRFILLILFPLFVFAENKEVLEASKSVIRIVSQLNDKDMATGTAFCVSSEGIFLTNAHVVDSAKAVFAIKSSTRYNVEVLHKDDQVDLAILRIKNTGLEPLVFSAKENINVTDKVLSIGFPGAADKSEDLDELTTVTINTGVIGKLSKIRLSIRPGSTSLSPVVQHDAAVNHGNSGGPLVDECGLVVGINVQKGLEAGRSLEQVVAGDVTQGIFYAIDIDIAKKLLADTGIQFLENSQKCQPGVALSVGGKEQKYLIAVVIVALLLLVWLALFVFMRRRGTAAGEMGETYINNLISRKIRGGERGEAQSSFVRLRSANHNAPDMKVGAMEQIVGRSSRADITINNPRISARHLSIVLETHGNVIVQDLGSSNGTYIEGVKLTPRIPYRLAPKERLVIGSEDVIYTIQ